MMQRLANVHRETREFSGAIRITRVSPQDERSDPTRAFKRTGQARREGQSRGVSRVNSRG